MVLLYLGSPKKQTTHLTTFFGLAKSRKTEQKPWAQRAPMAWPISGVEVVHAAGNMVIAGFERSENHRKTIGKWCFNML